MSLKSPILLERVEETQPLPSPGSLGTHAALEPASDSERFCSAVEELFLETSLQQTPSSFFYSSLKIVRIICYFLIDSFTNTHAIF